MKKILIIFSLSCLVFFSCTKEQAEKFEKWDHSHDYALIDDGYTKVLISPKEGVRSDSIFLKTIEYDGCEYVITSYDRGYGLSHKGNCKYCEERKRLSK